MWYELNRHIVIMNDMVSLKKEMVSALPSLSFSSPPHSSPLHPKPSRVENDGWPYVLLLDDMDWTLGTQS